MNFIFDPIRLNIFAVFGLDQQAFGRALFGCQTLKPCQGIINFRLALARSSTFAAGMDRKACSAAVGRVDFRNPSGSTSCGLPID
jgi:hypothetical protein